MKKHILLLAGTAVILASCGSNNTPPAQTQAQMDSAVNAKLAEHDAANAAKNDSTLKAIEAEKAAAAGKETEHHSTAHHSGGSKKEEAATPVAPPPPPPPAGGMKAHADQATAPGAAGKPASGGMRAHADQNQGK